MYTKEMIFWFRKITLLKVKNLAARWLTQASARDNSNYNEFFMQTNSYQYDNGTKVHGILEKAFVDQPSWVERTSEV